MIDEPTPARGVVRAIRRPVLGRLPRLAALRLPRVTILGLWIVAAAGLSQITGKITDWYVMTDELFYERLAISVAKTGSLLPNVHGVFVPSLDQLYPWLIAPVFAGGLVPTDFHLAHLLNAWIMSSACIPVFLLARRVTGRRWVAYLLAILSLTLPWIVFSSFLVTEVAAYPAFAWAMLGIQRATVSPSARNDLLALGGVVLALLARTELVALVAVLPLVLVTYEASQAQGPSRAARAASTIRATLHGHRVVSLAYAALVAGAVIFAAAGGNLLGVTVYGQTIQGGLFLPGTTGSFLGHVAQLAFGVGILPVVVGTAWLLANVVRPPGEPEQRAFAWLGSVTVVVILLEVATYDLRLGAGTPLLDRYLFYLVPVVLLAFVCALLDRRAPRLSLAVPTTLVCLGFAVHFQAAYTWNDPAGRINSDSPVSIFYHPIIEVAGSVGGAQAVLVAATIVLTGAFAAFASRATTGRRLAAVLLTVLAVGLPLETGYVFVRLFRVDGFSQRPLTGSGNGVDTLDWLDRTVGTDAQVTIVPYHVSTDYFVSLRFWRDIEFWNKSVVRAAEYPSTAEYADTGGSFRKIQLGIDPATGAVTGVATPYVVQSVTESRFRIAGNVQVQTPDVMLIDATHPWRLSWLSTGAYDDGWMKPGTPVHIRVYSTPGQAGSRTYLLSLQVWAPDGVASRPFQVVSNLQRYRGSVGDTSTAAVNGLRVCVPARGYADVVVTAQGSSTIPGDLSSEAASVTPRVGSVYLADTSVSDNIGGPCRP